MHTSNHVSKGLCSAGHETDSYAKVTNTHTEIFTHATVKKKNIDTVKERDNKKGWERQADRESEGARWRPGLERMENEWGKKKINIWSVANVTNTEASLFGRSVEERRAKERRISLMKNESRWGHTNPLFVWLSKLFCLGWWASNHFCKHTHKCEYAFNPNVLLEEFEMIKY